MAAATYEFAMARLVYAKKLNARASCTAMEYVFARGARDVTAVCLIAAPEGLATVEQYVGERADVTVVVAALDERLNEKAYIVPGLGDAGDRLYGIV